MAATTPGAAAFLNADRSVPRASFYFFSFVVLLIFAVGPLAPPPIPAGGVHDILEALATLLAFVVGALALVRFYTKKRGTFLFLGTGFSRIACINALPPNTN